MVDTLDLGSSVARRAGSTPVVGTINNIHINIMKEKIKARNSSGKDYECKYEWPCFVQCGGKGVVFGEGGGYTTAFFEAFPKKPSCFLRGEGATVEEAEEACWNRYQKVLTCEHEMERRNRTDGYGYCKHCTYSSMVFEPLTKCCKCNIPTAFGTDYKGKMYCKKHHGTRPKNPNAEKENSLFGDMDRRHRAPRKYKKLLKQKALIKFTRELPEIKGKLTFHVSCLGDYKITRGKYTIHLMFELQRQKLLRYK